MSTLFNSVAQLCIDLHQLCTQAILIYVIDVSVEYHNEYTE